MISREIQIYAAVLALFLAGAFYSWKAESSPKKARATVLVSMLDIGADELASVTLKQKDGKATKVSYEGKGDDKIAWVESTKPMVATTGAAAAPAAVSKFPGGDSATKLVEQYAPLKALRSFGKLQPKQRTQFELDEPKMTMAIETRGGKKHEIKIGGTSFGSQDYYVEDADGQAWLLKQDRVKPLLKPEDFMERALHELDEKEIGSIVVKSADEQAEFLHKDRHDAKAQYWVKPGSPDTRETQFATWLGKARRIPIVRYPEDQPGSTELPELSIVYRDDTGGTLARFEVMRRDGKSLVRTERTRVWAESDKRVDELLGEVDAIVR